MRAGCRRCPTLTQTLTEAISENWPQNPDCLFLVDLYTVELGQDAFLPSTTIFSVHPSHWCFSVGLNDTFFFFFWGRLLQETRSDERGEDTGCSLRLDETFLLEWIESKSLCFGKLWVRQDSDNHFNTIHVHLNLNLPLGCFCDEFRF